MMMMDDDNIQERINKPFFITVLRDSSATNLKLPTDFTSKHFVKDRFCENFVLTNKEGESWAVEIRNVGEDDYSFDDGWGKFVNDNKLESGDFLIFRLIDESTFQVAIYDESCCKQEFDADVSTNCVDEESDFVHLANSVKVEEGTEENLGCPGSEKTIHPVEHTSEKVLENPCLEKTDRPFFQRVLKRSSKAAMCLPKDFVRENGIRLRRGIVLRDATGMEWQTRVVEWGDGRVELGYGWRDLWKANHFLVGDTCLFKFFKGEDNTVDAIQVLRVKGRKRARQPFNSDFMNEGGGKKLYPNNSTKFTPVSKTGVNKRRQHENDCTDVENTVCVEDQAESFPRSPGLDEKCQPQFEIVIPKSYTDFLNLPKRFMQETKMSKGTTVVLRDIKGRDFPTKLLVSAKGRGSLCGGWPRFLRDTNLGPGDWCTFKYLGRDGGNSVEIIQVILMKQGERGKASNTITSDSESLNGESIGLNENTRFEINDDGVENSVYVNDQGEASLKIPNLGETRRHSNKRVKSKSHLRKVLRSGNFGHENGLSRIKTVLLRDDNGNAWPVKLSLYRDRRMAFCAGWSKFFKDNNLESGDICSFKFLKSDEDNLGDVVEVVTIKKQSTVRPELNNDSQCLIGEGRKKKLDPANPINSAYKKSRFGSKGCGDNPVHVKDQRGANVKYPDLEETRLPCYIRVIPKSGRCRLYLPAKFVQGSGMRRRKTILLKNDKGIEWPTRLGMTVDGRVELREGWSKFITDNNLVAGDTCLFKFPEHGKGSKGDSIQVMTMKGQKGRPSLLKDPETLDGEGRKSKFNFVITSVLN